MLSSKNNKEKSKEKMREYNYLSAHSKNYFLKNNTHLFDDKIKKLKNKLKMKFTYKTRTNYIINI